MSDINLIMLVGNAGNVAETHDFANGQVAKLSIATSRNYKDKSGEWQTDTTWHTVVTFQDFMVEKFLQVQKGDRCTVVGELKLRSYEKDGAKRIAAEIHCRTFDSVRPVRTEKASNYAPKQSISQPPQDGYDDDIPF